MNSPNATTDNTQRPKIFLGPDVLGSLRDSVKRYGWKSLPELPHASLKTLCQKTAELTQRVIDGSSNGIVSLTGYPGSGKSNKAEDLHGAVIRAFGGGPLDAVVPIYPDGHAGVARAFSFEKNGNMHGFTGIIPLDNSLNFLGDLRLKRLLLDTNNFRSGWGRRNGPADHLRYMLLGDPTDTRIYLGTKEEKDKKAPGGHLQLLDENADFSNIPSVFIVEGVDTSVHIEKLIEVFLSINRKRIEVLQILFDLPPNHSLVKVLGRDHDLKGYTFYDILKRRVEEHYYITKEYIIPAYNTPGMILIDPKRRVPYFDYRERSEILYSIEELEKNIRKDILLNKKPKKREFMLTLLADTRVIIERISTIKHSLDELRAFQARGKKIVYDDGVLATD